MECTTAPMGLLCYYMLTQHWQALDIGKHRGCDDDEHMMHGCRLGSQNLPLPASLGTATR